MFGPGQRIGVAVSGGADSSCLLAVLAEMAESLNLRLQVLHVDHGIRGPAGRSDAAFVRDMAARLGLPFHLREVDAGAFDSNLEQGGREARLGFFLEFLAAGALDRIAVGHTLDDQAETVLYRLIRGSGSRGLCAILPVTASGIVRPLIETTRAEVEAYLREREADWREDVTNVDRSYARNRIRHDLLPGLARDYNPCIREALARAARLSLEDEQYFAGEIDRLAGTALSREEEAVLIQCRQLKELPPALARRLLRHAIELVKGDLRSIDFGHIEQSLALAAAPDGSGRLQIPGVDVFRSFDWLRLAPPSRNNLETRNYRLTLDPPTGIKVPGEPTWVAAEVLEIPEGISAGPPPEARYNESVSDLDREKAVGRLELRNWRPGDQYQRVGRNAPEKIKVLFQQARVPLWKRRSWPIITNGDIILWAKQFGPAAEFAANESSRRILRIRVDSRGT